MQTAFLLLGLGILIFEVWWGWRMGIMRTLTSLVALGGSALLGMAAGRVVSAIVGGGAVVFWGTAIVVLVSAYVVIWFFGYLAFKKTSQQPIGVNFIWGMGGAVLGFVFGVLVLWLGIPAVRVAGVVGEEMKQAWPTYLQPVPPTISGLATLKENLETGITGKIFSSLDIVSPDFYDLVEKLSRFSADPTCIGRLMEYPDLKAVAELPEIQAMTVDPQMIAAIEGKNLLAVVTHPALFKLARDKKVSEMIIRIDFRKALDYAVGADAVESNETPESERLP